MSDDRLLYYVSENNALLTDKGLQAPWFFGVVAKDVKLKLFPLGKHYQANLEMYDFTPFSLLNGWEVEQMSLVKLVEIDCPWVEINKRQFNKYLERWILPPDLKQFFQDNEQYLDSDSGIALGAERVSKNE